MIGPWLVAEARARIAERNLRVMSKRKSLRCKGFR
jgi:hypothetical protein